MTGHAEKFLACLAPTIVAVAVLVYLELTIIAVIIGAAGIIAHAAWTWRSKDDGEVADASYFFGFLLTLVFLVVGLYRLGVASTAPAGGAATTTTLLQFLKDLAAGLVLTIVGLGVRQVRTLSSERGSESVATQAQLASAMTELSAALRARPEAQIVRDLEAVRSRAYESVQRFDESVAGAARRLGEIIVRLEKTITDATNAIARESTRVGASTTDAIYRVEVELGNMLNAMRQQREQAERELGDALKTTNALRAKADEQLLAHTELWQRNLEQARAAIAQTHATLDTEYRRGVGAFAETGTALRELTEAAAANVQALPNPAERLAGLWDNVRQLETTLAQSISGATDELTSLRERAAQVGAELTRLGGSAGEAATALTSGGTRMGDALLREIQQMNAVIEEYTALLEKTTRSLGARR